MHAQGDFTHARLFGDLSGFMAAPVQCARQISLFLPARKISDVLGKVREKVVLIETGLFSPLNVDL